MCLAVPGKIVDIDEQGVMRVARVNFNGMLKEVCIEWVPEAQIGSYVIVHAGFAIAVLDEKEALENLELINEAAQSPDAYRKW